MPNVSNIISNIDSEVPVIYNDDISGNGHNLFVKTPDGTNIRLACGSVSGDYVYGTTFGYTSTDVQLITNITKLTLDCNFVIKY